MIFLAATAAGIGFDLSATFGDAAILFAFAFVFFNLFLQACIIIAVLQSGGLSVPPRKWRIASLFGVGLLVGLGIFFGLLLLVLPGLFLAGRWFLAGPILFGEDASVSDALHASWERTGQHWLACTIIAAMCFLFQVAPLVASLYFFPTADFAPIGTVILTNMLSQAGWLFGIAAAATMYLAIGRGPVDAAEIFG